MKIPCSFINKKIDLTGTYNDDDKELLGEGGYGKVYKIKNKKTNDERAMKVIDKSKIPFDEQSDFLKEI